MKTKILSIVLVCGLALQSSTNIVFATEEIIQNSTAEVDSSSNVESDPIYTDTYSSNSNTEIETPITDADSLTTVTENDTLTANDASSSISTTIMSIAENDPYPRDIVDDSDPTESAYAKVSSIHLDSVPLLDNPNYYSMVITIDPGAAGVFTPNKIYSIGLLYDNSLTVEDMIINYDNTYSVTAGDSPNNFIVKFSKFTQLGRWISDSSFETLGHNVSVKLFFRGGIGTNGEGKLYYSTGPYIELPSRAEINENDLPLLKDEAIDKLEQKGEETKAAIDADKSLTAAEKEAQKAAVDEEVEKGKTAINDAVDIDSLNQIEAESLENIGSQHKPGTSLEEQKKAAIDKLEQKGEETKAAIDADKSLTAAEKEAQKAAVDEEVEKGKTAINDAVDIDSLNQIEAESLENIGSQHKPGTSLEEQKKAAIDKLEQKGEETKAAIDADKSLTAAEKEAQKAAVDEEVEKGKTAINDAVDIDSLNQIEAESLENIGSQHKPGMSLEEQKKAAIDKLEQKGEETKAAIDADKSLTAAEKEAQKKAVDEEVEKGKTAINNAFDMDSLNQITTKSLESISSQHRPSVAAETQKINTKGKDTKLAISEKTAKQNKVTSKLPETGSKSSKLLFIYGLISLSISVYVLAKRRISIK